MSVNYRRSLDRETVETLRIIHQQKIININNNKKNDDKMWSIHRNVRWSVVYTPICQLTTDEVWTGKL